MMDLSKMTLKTLEGWQDHYRSGVVALESELNAGYFLLQRVIDAINAKRQAMREDESTTPAETQR